MKTINFEELKCEEASILSLNKHVPCMEPGYALVWHQRDRRAYIMCKSCTSHNVHNRGGIQLTEAQPQAINKAGLLEQAIRAINEYRKQLKTHVERCEKCNCKVYENFGEAQQATESDAIIRKLNGWR